MKLPAAFRLCVSLIPSLRYLSLAIPSLYRHVSYFCNGRSDIVPKISNIPSRFRQGPITISMSYRCFLFAQSFNKKSLPCTCRARVVNPPFGWLHSAKTVHSEPQKILFLEENSQVTLPAACPFPRHCTLGHNHNIIISYHRAHTTTDRYWHIT